MREKEKNILFNKNFLLVWFGQLFSSVGNWIYNMFILIFIASLTDKAIVVSGMLLTSIIPSIVIGPYVGNIVDKRNKKYIMVGSDALRGILLLAIIPLLSGIKNNDGLLILLLFIISLASNTVGVFFDPSVRALIPIIVSGDLKKANSYFSMISSVSLIVGPAFGGTLVGIMGFKGVVILNAATFLVSSISEVFIKYTDNGNNLQKEIGSVVERYKLGWKILLNNIEIKYYIICAGARSLVVGLINISFVFVAEKVFMKGTGGVGYLYTALGCGLIIGSLCIGYCKYKMKDLKLYLFVIIINAIVSSIYIFSQNSFVVVISLFVIGISDGFQSVLLYSNIQNKIQAQDVGKVVACNNSFMMLLQMISMFVGGIAFDYIENSFVILVTTIIVIVWVSMHYYAIKDALKDEREILKSETE